jgi:hypothetical protein
VACDFRLLRRARVAERGDPITGSVHPTGNPMYHSQNVGLRCPPTAWGKSEPARVCAGPGPFSSRAQSVGSSGRFWCDGHFLMLGAKRLPTRVRVGVSLRPVRSRRPSG